jgi:hypothetical protein
VCLDHVRVVDKATNIRHFHALREAAGVPHWSTGVARSEEVRQRISAGLTGHVATPEHREANRQAQLRLSSRSR